MGSTVQGDRGRLRAARLAAAGLSLVLLGGCAALDSPPVDVPGTDVDAPSTPGGSTPDAEAGGSAPGDVPTDVSSEAGGSDKLPDVVVTDAPGEADDESPDGTTGTDAPSDEPTDGLTDEPGDDPTTGDASTTTALAALGELKVKGRAPKTGYDRDAFRYRAVDLDRNGCDTRNDILRRDLTDVTLKPGTHDCVVESGVLADPYSALSIDFTRGTATSNDVQIDHVVALSDAWQKGAQRWSQDTLALFGNDPLNLLAVDGPLNNQKGDGDAATWLPPSKPFRCQYVARQIAVKHAYGLWVTAAEKSAMERVLGSCADEPLPTDDSVVRVVVLGDKPTEKPADKPTDKPADKPTQKPSAKDELDPDYGTCKEAIRAGAGPYYRDRDPEYYYYRDGDKDGVTCERP